MAGPWEKYQSTPPAEQPSEGPWTRYQSQAEQSPPQNGGDIVSANEQRFGLPPGLLGAVISKESDGNADAISGKGAIGLAQVMPNTARGMGYDPEELKRNPALQVEAGARYLKQMLDAHGGNVAEALAAYNWGPGNVQKFKNGEKIQVPQETVNYVTDPRFAQWTQPSQPGSEGELQQLSQQAAQPWPTEAQSPTLAQSAEQAARGIANIPTDLAQGGVNIVNAAGRAAAWANGVLGVNSGGFTPMPDVYRPVAQPSDPYAQAGEAIGNYLIPGVGPVGSAMIGSVANAGNQPGDFAENASKEMLLNAALMGAPALYRGAKGLIQGARGASAESAAVNAADNAAGGIQAESSGQPRSVIQISPDTEVTGAQIADSDAGDAIRNLAAQRNPDLASSLDGLNVNPQQDVVQAANRLGVESVLPSHLSGNAQYQAVEQAIKSRPGSALKVQEDKAIGELASGAGKIIDDIAGAPDALGMSESYVNQINGRMAALQRRSDQLYSRVDRAMAPGTRIEAPGTASILEREADNLGGWENLDPIEKAVFKAVNPGPDGVLTYANLNKQRRLVGEALQKNSGPYKDADRAALSRLYGSLAEDQKAALSGTDSLRDFEVAQRLVQMRKTMENQMVTLRGKTLNGDVTYKATNALQAMSKGNAKGFRELMENTPSRNLRTELIGTALRDMLSSGKRGADFNPGGYADWWQNMQASGQIRTLSQHLPKETMAGLNDVYKVARAIKNAKSYEITTGRLNEFIDRFNRVTATHEMAARHAQKIGTMVGSYGGPLGAIAGAEVGQRIAEKARLAGGAGSTEAADKLISSPEFQRAVKSLPASAPEHVMDSRVRKSPQWRDFFDSLPEEDRRTIARLGIVRWLMQDQEEY